MSYVGYIRNFVERWVSSDQETGRRKFSKLPRRPPRERVVSCRVVQ